MTEKSFKKDWPNSREESESLKSVVDLKFKLVKSKTESLTLSVLQRLLLQKVLFQEVAQPFFMPQSNSTNSSKALKT